MGVRVGRVGGKKKTTVPKSRSPYGQYEDGATGNAQEGGMGTKTSSYKLGITIIEPEKTITEEDARILNRLRSSSRPL